MRIILIVWSITATVAAVAFGILTLLLFLRVGHSRSAPDGTTAEAFFAHVSKESLMGVYTIFENDVALGTVTLHPDGSVTNWHGETKPGYQWKVQPEGLLLNWSRGYNFFPRIVSDGVFEGRRQGKSVRLAKIEREE